MFEYPQMWVWPHVPLGGPLPPPPYAPSPMPARPPPPKASQKAQGGGGKREGRVEGRIL